MNPANIWIKMNVESSLKSAIICFLLCHHDDDQWILLSWVKSTSCLAWDETTLLSEVFDYNWKVAGDINFHSIICSAQVTLVLSFNFHHFYVIIRLRLSVGTWWEVVQVEQNVSTCESERSQISTTMFFVLFVLICSRNWPRLFVFVTVWESELGKCQRAEARLFTDTQLQSNAYKLQQSVFPCSNIFHSLPTANNARKKSEERKKVQNNVRISLLSQNKKKVPTIWILFFYSLMENMCEKLFKSSKKCISSVSTIISGGFALVSNRDKVQSRECQSRRSPMCVIFSRFRWHSKDFSFYAISLASASTLQFIPQLRLSPGVMKKKEAKNSKKFRETQQATRKNF